MSVAFGTVGVGAHPCLYRRSAKRNFRFIMYRSICGRKLESDVRLRRAAVLGFVALRASWGDGGGRGGAAFELGAEKWYHQVPPGGWPKGQGGLTKVSGVFGSSSIELSLLY